jgi:methyltransferase (TIGR00027 family)
MDRVEEVEAGNLLASTAYWTAAVRARESARADRLFDDPWAASLAGPQGEAWIEQRTEDSTLPIALRTRFYDDFLERITADEGIRQVALLAAGLDTRAYRLDWPAGQRVYELDQAPVLAHKEALLRQAGAAPSCERQAIGIDLNHDWETALIEAGFDPERPSGWLLEGFLFYLPAEALTQVLERALALASPGSWVGFDVINSLTLTSPLTRGWVQMQAASGAPWIGTMDDPEGFLAARGWRASLTPLGAPEASYGRWPFPPMPVTMPRLPRLWFVTAEKT